MALGANVKPIVDLDNQYGASFPSSISSDWVDVIDAGGLSAADNATITNPTTQITASTRHILQRNRGTGTLVQVRMKYDAATTALGTSLVIKVFGRYKDSVGNSTAWQPLYNRSSGLQTTVAIAATDVTNGTNKYTTPDPSGHTFDCQGCDEILIGVEVAPATPTGGTIANFILQAKVI